MNNRQIKEIIQDELEVLGVASKVRQGMSATQARNEILKALKGAGVEAESKKTKTYRDGKRTTSVHRLSISIGKSPSKPNKRVVQKARKVLLSLGFESIDKEIDEEYFELFAEPRFGGIHVALDNISLDIDGLKKAKPEDVMNDLRARGDKWGGNKPK